MHREHSAGSTLPEDLTRKEDERQPHCWRSLQNLHFQRTSNTEYNVTSTRETATRPRLPSFPPSLPPYLSPSHAFAKTTPRGKTKTLFPAFAGTCTHRKLRLVSHELRVHRQNKVSPVFRGFFVRCCRPTHNSFRGNGTREISRRGK